MNLPTLHLYCDTVEPITDSGRMDEVVLVGITSPKNVDTRFVFAANVPHGFVQGRCYATQFTDVTYGKGALASGMPPDDLTDI